MLVAACYATTATMPMPPQQYAQYDCGCFYVNGAKSCAGSERSGVAPACWRGETKPLETWLWCALLKRLLKRISAAMNGASRSDGAWYSVAADGQSVDSCEGAPPLR